MSIAKVIEISAESENSFEDAITTGLEKAAKTVDNIESAWIKDQIVSCENGAVSRYRVHMKVTFETRLHEKAPFGVVSCRMQFEMKRDGKVLQTVDGTAKLIDFGKDAKTTLPDHN